MNVLIEHWGDDSKFAFGELVGVLEGEQVSYEIIEEDYPVTVLRVEHWNALKRLGFARYVSRHITSSESIPELSLSLPSFYVRAKRYAGSKLFSASEVERKLGRVISGKVNFNSDNVVRAAITNKLHVGILLYDFSEVHFEERTPNNLPVSYPITMHPRYSRALINIARIKSGASILDPFCGTGAMMIEALLMGFRVTCGDKDARMLSAAELNMKKFGVGGELMKGDVEIHDGHYDAIITDPPYGRSSSLQGENIYKLYSRAFRKFSELTDNVAIVLPDEKSIKIGEEYFTLVEEYPVRVHKSLTRHYCFFRSE